MFSSSRISDTLKSLHQGAGTAVQLCVFKGQFRQKWLKLTSEKSFLPFLEMGFSCFAFKKKCNCTSP